jgi:hypothetical protein
MGWGEEGASGAALFILLLLVRVVQWARPTLLLGTVVVPLLRVCSGGDGNASQGHVYGLSGAFFFVVLFPPSSCYFGRPKSQ